MKADKKQVRSEANEGLIASTRWPKEAPSGDCWFITERSTVDRRMATAAALHYGNERARDFFGVAQRAGAETVGVARIAWCLCLTVYMGGPCGWFPRAFRSKILSSVRHCDVAFPRLHIFIIVSRSISNSSSSITPLPPSVVRNDCSIPLCHWRVVCLPVRPNYYPGPTPLTGDSQSFFDIIVKHHSFFSIRSFNSNTGCYSLHSAFHFVSFFCPWHFLFHFLSQVQRCYNGDVASYRKKKFWPPVKSNLMNRLCQNLLQLTVLVIGLKNPLIQVFRSKYEITNGKIHLLVTFSIIFRGFAYKILIFNV